MLSFIRKGKNNIIAVCLNTATSRIVNLWYFKHSIVTDYAEKAEKKSRIIFASMNIVQKSQKSKKLRRCVC